MGQTVLGIAILAAFFSIGVPLIRNPKSHLSKLGRPLTDKHVRAMRIIGVGFVALALLGLVQFFRRPH